MYNYSDNHQEYLKKIKKEKRTIILFQVLISVLFLISWELLSHFRMINPFLYSSPSNIIKTISTLISDGALFIHIWITTYETIISFLLASCIGFFIATILWWNKKIALIFDPYLIILNSLPKVALGPLIIIWVGASIRSIIVMSLFISIFVVIINIYNGFSATDKNYIKLLKSFGATKFQIFFKGVLPANYITIINSLKLNISMSLIGIIMGELLVSKSGLGYLIVYGSQVFNINLVITSVFILGILSYLFYLIINQLERYIIKNTKQ